MKNSMKLFIVAMTAFMLIACVHKIVTVPVKVAYKTTKAVVKGTVAVGKVIIPDGDDDDKEKDDKKK